MEVITTREPPGPVLILKLGRWRNVLNNFLPTSTQFPAFFSVLKMASESAKSRKNRDFSCFFGSGLWKNCYLGVITTRKPPKTGSGFQVGKVKELSSNFWTLTPRCLKADRGRAVQGLFENEKTRKILNFSGMFGVT